MSVWKIKKWELLKSLFFIASAEQNSKMCRICISQMWRHYKQTLYQHLSKILRTNFFLLKYTSNLELHVSFHKSGTSNPFQTYFFFELQTARMYRDRKRGTSRQKQSAFHWREKGVVMEKGGGEIFTAHC